MDRSPSPASLGCCLWKHSLPLPRGCPAQTPPRSRLRPHPQGTPLPPGPRRGRQAGQRGCRVHSARGRDHSGHSRSPSDVPGRVPTPPYLALVPDTRMRREVKELAQGHAGERAAGARPAVTEPGASRVSCCARREQSGGGSPEEPPTQAWRQKSLPGAAGTPLVPRAGPQTGGCLGPPASFRVEEGRTL